MKWTATFQGRQVGAIGVFSRFEIQVEGDTREEANLAIYETHEHISDLNLRPTEPTSIGNVDVIAGDPIDGNPYKGPSLSGKERADALRAFRDGGDTNAFTFWHAPASGGARPIFLRDEIDWRGMGEDR